MKAFAILAPIFLLCLILVSCNTASPDVDEPVTLKVLTLHHDSFRQTYGNYYMAVQENVDFEIIALVDHITDISDFDHVAQRLYTQHQPDIIALPMNYIYNLDDESMLAPLDTWVKQEKLDLSAFSPSIIAYLTNDRQQLIGLTPTFVGSAIFYNKALFASHNIAEPVDYMTWGEIFELASRFPTAQTAQSAHTDIYGFSDNAMRSPMLMALQMGGSQRLVVHDGEQFTLNTPAWASIFEILADCIEAEACHNPDQIIEGEPTTERQALQKRIHPFLNGNVALAHDTSDLYAVLSAGQTPVSFDWGVVSAPVSQQYPDTGGAMRLDNVFAIAATSDKMEAAGDFLSYVLSDRFNRVLSFSGSTHLPSRPPVNADANLQAFYRLPYIANSADTGLRTLPGAVVSKFDQFSSTHFSSILDNYLSISSALSEMEAELQVIYNAEKQKPLSISK